MSFLMSSVQLARFHAFLESYHELVEGMAMEVVQQKRPPHDIELLQKHCSEAVSILSHWDSTDSDKELIRLDAAKPIFFSQQ